MSEMESETQWRVTWFPPDRDDVTRTGTEAQVRKMAEMQSEWAPIVETREITVSPWEVESNAIDECGHQIVRRFREDLEGNHYRKCLLCGENLGR